MSRSPDRKSNSARVPGLPRVTIKTSPRNDRKIPSISYEEIGVFNNNRASKGTSKGETATMSATLIAVVELSAEYCTL